MNLKITWQTRSGNIALSLAAQLGTFPLSLLYFHQFPNYFILTNLVVVPLAAIILYLAIAFVFLYWIPYLSSALAGILNWSVKAMIFSVYRVEHLPFSVTKDISLDSQGFILLYLAIFSFAFYVHFRIRRSLFFSLGLFVLFLGNNIYNQILTHHQHAILVYQMKGASLLVAEKGREAILLFSGKKTGLQQNCETLAKGYLLEKGVKKLWSCCLDSIRGPCIISPFNGLELTSQGGMVFLRNGDKTVIWMKGKVPNFILPDSLHSNLCVFAGLYKCPNTSTLEKLRSEKYILDSSCKLKSAEIPSVIFLENLSNIMQGHLILHGLLVIILYQLEIWQIQNLMEIQTAIKENFGIQ